MTENEAAAFLKAMKRAVDIAAAALTPLVAAYLHFGRSVYAMAWHSYIMAGAPYGETAKGLNRWLNEQRALNT